MPSTTKKNEKRAGAVARARSAGAGLFAMVLLGASVLCAVPGVAQVTTLPTVRNKVKNPKKKFESFHGDVVSFTNVAITVRDRKNLMAIRTFSFSPELTRKMENRRIEPGERVTVRFLQNTDTAVELKGKIQKDTLPMVLTKPRARKN